MDKVVANAADAIADIDDRAVVGISGFGASHNFPVDLIQACAAKEISGLTLVCNSLGVTEDHPRRLVTAGRVSCLRAAFSARAAVPDSSAQQQSPVPIDVELIPQGILVERLRAAGAGLGPFYSPVGVDTDLADGREIRHFDGRDHLLEYPLHLDYAFVYAAAADRAGNVAFRGTSENLAPSVAKAAKVVIVQVDEIFEVGELPTDEIDLPGVFVDRVVRSASTRVPAWSQRRDDDERRLYHGKPGLTPREIGRWIAELLPHGSYVNLGVGLPTQVSDFVTGRDISLHAENGALGYSERLSVEHADPDAYNAGGEPIMLGPGASVFDSVRAFEIARGGHLDAVVLGAFQVDARGSFANWTTPRMGGGAIGGAMDLIVAPGRLIIAMRHTERNGRPKVVSALDYPLTGKEIVDIVVTDLAVMERDTAGAEGFVLRRVAAGFEPHEILELTEAPLRIDLWGSAPPPPVT
ncbi:3-oxoacid CoA-transferase [Amycolatopsis pigmentata]|uniref:3-oxoacid CoA-transferase n=1 Tax=Amycolatopsis pigmentata TaxID=450801 RepID=A0ABW5FMS9_9PSEU